MAKRDTTTRPIAAAATDKVKLSSPFIGAAGPLEILATLGEIGRQMLARPEVLAAESRRLLGEVGRVLTGRADIAPPRGDKRFADDAWRRSPLHRLALQGYLAWSDTMNRMVDRAGGEGPDIERMRYVVSLLTGALAPGNTLAGNPAALRKAVETGGASLVAGLQNMLEDLVTNNGMPSQVDKAAFRVGENLAATAGAVVFKTPVLEMIQYTPTTASVFTRPLMLVPPIVNKFYMFDLAPGKSVVEYLLDSGFQVFAISWRNPTPSDRDWGLDTYVAALVEAAAALRQISASPTVNLYTVCTGAIPTAAFMGQLRAKGDGSINSATLVVSVLDSNGGRSLGLFATPQAIAAAKRKSTARGVLGGAEMGRAITWMRPNDLVWSYWVDNYLLGNQPGAVDMLYWNNDPINLPAKLHADVLDIFADDLLRRPGALRVLDTAIDLSRIDYDTFVVGGTTDHISVWKGSYESARLLGGRAEFVLNSGGHVQTVIDPPGNPKARYHVNRDLPEDPEEWLAAAQLVPGSWWHHWRDWLAHRSGETRPAPAALGSERFAPGEPAPGAYVMERC
jgi:polyhydroxyalkanoate synthase subunit PhaC